MVHHGSCCSSLAFFRLDSFEKFPHGQSRQATYYARPIAWQIKAENMLPEQSGQETYYQHDRDRDC